MVSSVHLVVVLHRYNPSSRGPIRRLEIFDLANENPPSNANLRPGYGADDGLLEMRKQIISAVVCFCIIYVSFF